MTKQFTVLDQPCAIQLTKNARYELKKGTHAITHDDYETKTPIHNCTGIIQGVDQIKKEFTDWTPEGIRGVVAIVEQAIKRRVESDEKITAVDLVLKELGFK